MFFLITKHTRKNSHFFFLLPLLFALYCTTDTFESVPASYASLPDADIEISNFSAISFDKEQTQWKLNAKHAVLFERTKETRVFDIVLYYYTSARQNQDEATKIEASEGIIREDTKSLKLKGNVVVSSANGRKLYTSQLEWSNEQKELRSNENVKIVMKSGDTIMGTGLITDSKLNKIVLTGGQGYHP